MASSRAPLHLATVSDSRFLPHVATLLNSLAAANRPHDVTMHLLHDGSVTAALQDQLRGEAARLGISIDFLQPTYEALKTLPPSSNYYPSLIWYRVLLPSLLDGLDRVLYLDADTLVLQDLHPIWSTELEGALLAAVPQPWDGQHSGPALTRMGLPSDARYFNSGVLLMNLRAMREQRFQQRVLEIGHMQAEQWADSTHFPLPDQDALNFACFGQWAELHPKWNCLASMFLTRRNSGGDLTASEAIASPAILHFEGSIFAKPWNYRCVHPLRHLYRAYRRDTPWPLETLEGSGLAARLLHLLPPSAQLRIGRLKANLERPFRVLGQTKKTG